MSTQGRLVLSAGPGRRVMFLWGVIFLVAMMFLGFSIYATPTLAASGDSVFAAVIAGSSIIFFLSVIMMAIAAYRRTFWLEDHMLWRKGVFRDQSYDIAAYPIGLKSKAVSMVGPSMPHLEIRPPGKRPVRLWLRNRDARFALLPPEQLHALADLILSVREGDPDAVDVVRRLRRLADDAF